MSLTEIERTRQVIPLVTARLTGIALTSVHKLVDDLLHYRPLSLDQISQTQLSGDLAYRIRPSEFQR